MSGSSIAGNGVCSFRDYAIETSPEQLRKHLVSEPTCLADFIQAWVQGGEGIGACNGDLQTFLITVIGIIDDWRNNAQLLDYVTDEEQAAGASTVIQRRPESILGERGTDHVIVDPHFFTTMTFRYLHGKRNEQ